MKNYNLNLKKKKQEVILILKLINFPRFLGFLFFVFYVLVSENCYLLQLLYSTNGPKSALKNPNLEIGQKVQLGQSNGSVNPSKSNTTEDEEYNKNRNQQQFQMQLQMFPNHQNHNYGPSSSSVTLGININNNDNNGLIALPDLNSTAEELIDAASYQQFDETTTNRVLAAAQARKTRLQIFRLKKPFGNNSKQYLI